MKRFLLQRFAPTVWGRLLWMIGSIVVTVWAVLAVSTYFFWVARQENNALAQEHIPRLALSSELAEASAELAALAMAIVSGDPAQSKTLRDRLARSSDALSTLLQSPILLENDPENIRLQTDIRSRLTRISTALETRQTETAGIEALVEQLRWLNVDIQYEIDPALGDFTFNIEIAMDSLTQSSDPEFRSRIAQQISVESATRDLIFNIGAEASTATTLLLQSAVSTAPSQLVQFSGLMADALAELNVNLAKLPDKTEYLTLRQSVVSLNDLANGDSGILARRADWLTNQTGLLTDLTQLQEQFSKLQLRLSALGLAQRQAVELAIRQSVERFELAMGWLFALTIISGLAGGVILFGYIRGGVIKPLRQMTSAMQNISLGKVVKNLPQSGEDEIGQMGAAVIAFQQSVQARERAIEQLHQTQAELVQAGKMAALGNLSAGISHELNQPLAAIQQRLYLLEDAEKKQNRANIRRQIDRISGLVERMSVAIKHLKRFARRSEYKRESLNFAPLLNNAIAILRGKIDLPEINLTLDKSCAKAVVLGDQILIEQVLINLLSNAVDAILETDRAGDISVVAILRAKTVRIEISDTGAGLGQLTPDEAIDPFVTTKEIGAGLGLGLSISYNIAKDMGGDLRLEPIDPDGTRAIFILQKGAQA